ncbi:hypothetical protein AB0M20_36905, partial [Actinoplanes sp. NPDC051633]|uniref:hypothetical protein n=1 Tax=Actinoplanes sp. NPDC051633 TaxID=3155670 RepID=UPI00343FC642
MVEHRDARRQLVGLVEVLRGQQDRGAAGGDLTDRLPEDKLFIESQDDGFVVLHLKNLLKNDIFV